jgi:peptidyl-prolyl cis-trans isomerase B (cyclophilin B)
MRKEVVMRKRILLTASVFAILLPLSTWIGCAATSGGGNMMEEKEQVAVITTDKGKIVIELYPDSAPATVDNFRKLIKKKFYDWLTFHRREDKPGLNIIQGGDPNGDGTGGPGYTIIDEHTNPNQVPHQRGAIAMANTGNPNSAGSQFYICLKAQPFLDGRYTTFGQVIQGMEVVDLLRVGDEMKKVRLEAKSKYVTSE